jgi:transcriptional regulator with XRE-family HTH domain
MEIFEQLTKQRKAQNKSAKEIAQAIGVTHTTVYNWEYGKNKPSMDLCEKYAEALGYKLVLILDTNG